MPEDIDLRPGLIGTASVQVEDRHTAMAVGSGSEPAFATPMLAALFEAAAVDCICRALPSGHTSLGVHLSLDHLAATPVGHTVTVTAELTEIKARKLTFRLEARDDVEAIGRGQHVRIVVNRQQFAGKLQAKQR